MSRATRREALQLLALSSFALAQPLFAVLGRYPGWFAAHRIGPLGVMLFGLVLVVVPWLVLLLIERLAGVFGAHARRWAHVVLVAALVGFIALPFCSALPAVVAYVVAGVLGIAFAFVYVRQQRVRVFTTVLAIGPVLFLVAFLCLSSTGRYVRGDSGDAWAADASYRPPVVFIQLDAFPILLAETPDHRIDQVRFPNLARLSRDGVWYRNVSNTHENTVFSIPSILSGQYPRKGTNPVVQDWNPNLFTLLGNGYSMNVAEEATSLCPPAYCRRRREPGKGRLALLWDDMRVVFNHIWRPDDQRGDLPTTRRSWTDYSDPPPAVPLKTRKKTPEYVIRHLHAGRIGRYRRWLRHVGQSGGLPELDFIHMFMPHEPREFLPDGRRYATPDPVLSAPASFNSRYLSDMEEQRVILQIGYTDKIIGEIIARLEHDDMYKRALIVVVADHGESFRVSPRPAAPFQPGHLSFRRSVSRQNLEDIASIPLFIKYPEGHGPQGIDSRYVRTVDIFPTIAEVTHHLLPARVAGTSLLKPGYRGHDTIREATTFDGVLRMDVRRWQARRDLSLGRRLRLFGSGQHSVYAWGPHRELVGRRVSGFRRTPARGVRATIANPRLFRSVDPSGPVCLCLLGGRIDGARPAGMPLAIAVNGRIAATAEGFTARHDERYPKRRLNWAAMIPPTAYRKGRNTVQIFRIEGNALRPLGRY